MTITAKIIQDSYNPVHDARITTFELMYPRFILAELNTHRALSKNSSSSRAIPVQKMLEYIENNPAMPVFWGKNKAGMQATEEVENVEDMKECWEDAASRAASFSRIMYEAGLHKQVTNRITEPFQTMKTVVSGTCFNNFFALRAHSDAQPEIKELAEKMLDVYNQSYPINLKKNEWHVPYVTRRIEDKVMKYFDENDNEISAEDARIISASCCAQTSYRLANTSLEKASGIFDKLINSKPAHSSPVEHQATPITVDYLDHDLTAFFDVEGVTHIDRNSVPWSGNLHGWVQFRQLIKDNAVPY